MNPRKNQMYSVGLRGSPCKRSVPPCILATERIGVSACGRREDAHERREDQNRLRRIHKGCLNRTKSNSILSIKIFKNLRDLCVLCVMLFFLSLETAQAGDILRGGFSARTAPAIASGSGNTATVARLRANEQDVLSRTTQALQAVQVMQSAARNMAQNGPNNLGLDPNHPGQQLPNIPNGLTTGGLQVASGATANSALWQNANLPTQSASNGQTTVTITQTAPKAILTWQTFNVGKNTTADFNQSAGTENGTNSWIALNRVLDPAGVPSQILGSIKADGQVYLINQNGIIFGGGSQVNVNTLIASTLNIPDAAFDQGFLAYTANNYNSSAVFSTSMGNASPSAGNTFPSFSRFYQRSDTGAPTATTNPPSSADVVAQPGSSITTSAGGRVILLGAHVKNAGTISTPDGQTILAAGDSAYLYANPTPQMRGLSVDVLIDPNTNNTTTNPLADPTIGTITNSGLITVGKGNATLDGAIIAQKGIISALTGVDFNGSIILTARYAPDTSAAATNSNCISPTIPGSVTLGPYSVTEVLPDLSDPTTTLDAQGFNPSVVVVQGKTVAFEGASFPGAPLIGLNGQAISPGAQLIAPGGTVSVTAPIKYGTPIQGSDFANAFGLQPPFPFGPIYATSAADGAGARIFIDNGATIDVSGTQDVSVPVSRNVVAVNLRANELRDSPLQRNGPLYGKTVNVDITVTGTNADGSTWYGTPFADASGYIALIGRTVAERTAIGGAINLISAGDVVAVNGSTMNVSGGWLDYQSGIVSTTRLLGTDGHLYDIANADPNLTYVGIAGGITITHPRWGVTEKFGTPLVSGTDQRFEQGFIDGRSAGSIAVTANEMILDGTLLGNSVSGPRQRTINANVDSSVPLGGSLTLQAPPDINTLNPSGYANAIQDNLTFVTDHPDLTAVQALALSDGTLPLSDPSIDRDQTLLLPVDMFSTGGFTTLSTEASANIVTTTAAGSTSTKTITTTSPLGGNVSLPEGVALEFGTAGSGTINFNYDGTVARNADGTISMVSVNSNNSANLIVDAYVNVDLEGSITAPAGRVSFTAGVLYTGKLVYDPAYLANPPSITVGSVQGSSPTFRLRGLWTNETNQPPDNTLQPLWINGGSFSLSAPGAIMISSGSLFDVIGGGRLHSNGKMAASDQGKGGSLSFLGDTNPYLSGNNGQLANNELKPISFNGTFLAYGMGGNGTLALGAGAISFTNDPGTVISSVTLETSSGPTPGILVPAGLVAAGGFSSYAFASATDLRVTDGTELLPTQKVLATGDIQKLENAPTGADIYTFTSPTLQPQFERKPTNLTLTANNSIIVGEGATIQTDPGAALILKATPLRIVQGDTSVLVAATSIDVLGTLDAPGGMITLDGGFPADRTSIPAKESQSNAIYLGPRGVVSAVGASLLTVDTFGHTVGSVLDGGTITVQNTLYFIAKPGSLIDVSGAETAVDLAGPPLQANLLARYTSSSVASNGGSINLAALSGLFLDGTLSAHAGDYTDPAGSVALGGSLVIQIFGQPLALPPQIPVVQYANGGLIVSQNTPSPVAAASGAAVPSDESAPGSGFVTAQTLARGGFDAVSLNAGQFIQFVGGASGMLTISGMNNLEIHAPDFTATTSYSPAGNYSAVDSPIVTLQAYHIWLDGAGSSTDATSSFSSVTGEALANHAVLNVHATTLDINGFGSGQVKQLFLAGDGRTPLATVPALPSLGKVNFIADGDLRFVASPSAGNSTQANGVNYFLPNSDNEILLNGAVSFQATQIYPLSGVTETIMDNYQPSRPTDPASITFVRSSSTSTGTTPLSAGSSLGIFGSVINQGGVIKVPLGSLTLGSITGSYNDLNGNHSVPLTQSLTLTPQSVTSVSLDGNIVPYGNTTSSGSTWFFNSGDPLFGTESVPAGFMALSGADIHIQANAGTGGRAIINGSGGGDLYAYEFAPGVGGSNDVLDQPSTPNSPGVYAILPGYDQYSMLGSPASVTNGASSSPDSVPRYGQMVRLSGVAGLPTGDYVLLPAHYALLPGGYRITLASSKISPLAQNVVNPNGSYDTLGYFETATTSGARADGTHNPSQQFNVESGSVVRQNSQYLESFANTFTFKNIKTGKPIFPLLPQDADQLVVSPTQALELDGQGAFAHAPGTIGGRVDLNVSRDIAIVGDGGTDGTTGASGTDYGSSAIVIKASGLDNLNAESILIGGTRQIASNPNIQNAGQNQTYIVAATSSITVDNGADVPLQAPEIILASGDRIDLTSTSVMSAVGTVTGASTGDLNFVTNFDFLPRNNNGAFGTPTGAPGSLVRVSDGPVINFNRFTAANSSGNLTIEGGARLSSGNAILVEGYQTATLRTGALLQGPSITAAGNLVSLGNVPVSEGPTLAFSGQTFQALNATHDLTLISATSIDFWGLANETTSIGNTNLVDLVLDAVQFSNRVNGSSVKLTAANITLRATSSANFSPRGSTSGSLILDAAALANGTGGQLTISGGARYLDGFDQVTFAASRQIVSQGTGSLQASGSLTLVTPLLTAASNSGQQITAIGAFNLENAFGTAPDPEKLQSFNSGLFITASNVSLGGSVIMPSGVFTAEATKGDVVLTSGAIIDVGGVAEQFYDRYRYAPGGQVNLTADLGNVTSASDTTINVSGFLGAPGVPAGGDAGTLSVTAGASAASPATGLFTNQGHLLGSAAPGNVSGSFVLNAGSIADFTGLNAQLNAGGFAQSRNFRVRTGPIVVAGSPTAHTFILSADAGDIDVQGTINASGNSGGTIFLAAGGNVTLGPGSLLDAHATVVAVDAYGKPIDAENEAHVEIDTTNGTLNLAGGIINVSVPGQDSVTGLSFGGDVHLRAPLIANGAGDGIQVSSVGNIIGATSVDLEASQAFTPTNVVLGGGVGGANLAIIDNALVDTIQTVFAGFSGVAPPIAGLASIPAGIVHFRPGVEIYYNGDIAVEVTNDTDPHQSDVNGVGTAGWDFSTWRYNNEPGYLTVRAAGNLTVINSMSDGFTGVTSYSFANTPFNPKASYYSTQTTGPSWGYTLVSGAALGAVDRRQLLSQSVLAGQGNFTLDPDNYIRTGTGDVTISVGGSLTLGNELSTIYTAGIPTVPINPAVDYNQALNPNPPFNPNLPFNSKNNRTPNPINFPTDGGNIVITAQGAIIAVQTPQIITDWLWREGGTNPAVPSGSLAQPAFYMPVAWGPIFGLRAPVWSSGFPPVTTSSTGNYSFAQGVGALGGGNITINAGGSITDLSVVIPSNGYQTSGSGNPVNANNLAIQGGGDLIVRSGGNIGAAPGDLDMNQISTDGGGVGAVFYVARGQGNIATLRLSNAPGTVTAEIAMDDAAVAVRSGGDLKVAPFDPMAENQVFANQNNFSLANLTFNRHPAQVRSYEFGYTSRTELDETSLSGDILPAFQPFIPGAPVGGASPTSDYTFLHHEWARSSQSVPFEYSFPSLTGDQIVTGTLYQTVQVLPTNMRVTAFAGGIFLPGSQEDISAESKFKDAGYEFLGADFQFPDARGTAEYLANQDVSVLPALSDADPTAYPTLINPQTYSEIISANFLSQVLATVPQGTSLATLPNVSQVHSPTLLHSGDPNPVRVYSVTGSVLFTNDLSGTAYFFEIPKPVWIKAGLAVSIDLNSASVYNDSQLVPVNIHTTPQWIENLAPSDISLIEAGQDVDLNIRIDGPGTLYVQAGRNVLSDTRILSEGNGDDNALPGQGANVTLLAGLGGIGTGYYPNYAGFIQAYFNPANASNVATNYLNTVENALNLSAADALTYLESLSPELQSAYVLPAYFNELKMSGRDFNNSAAPDFGSYRRGFAALDLLFPGASYAGDIDLSGGAPVGGGGTFINGEVTTVRGGNIQLLAPAGPITVGQPNGTASLASGLTTVRGGSISTYSAGSVEVNQSRLATLGGGSIIIWAGNTDPAKVPNPPFDKIANIDAGKGSKTELVAPPQSFLIDDATGAIGLDPAAVATGNGIATLPAVKGAPPSDIDLIAPDGTVNASDAGIRVSGNFSVAALHVVTNGNVTVAGTSVGVPTVVAPNIGGLTAASNTAGASSNASEQVANQAAAQTQQQELPSVITVEVLGYGGGG